MKPAYRYFGDIQQNHLLAVLPQADVDRWRGQLEPVELSRNQVLCAAGCTPEYVYFPITMIASLMYLTQEGSSAEVAVIGNDGVVGVSLLLGGGSAPSEAVVQSAGLALRLSASFLKSEIDRSGAIMRIMLRYAQAVLGQVSQTAVCNRYHSIDQQLCRRLLVGLDRSYTDEIEMTHELAANLGRASRRHHHCGPQAARGRPDPLPPGPCRGAGPSASGEAGLRVLCRSAAGIPPPAAHAAGRLSEALLDLDTLAGDDVAQHSGIGFHAVAQTFGRCTQYGPALLKQLLPHLG
jgi:CRP-like cAMP-binding protein